MSKPYIDQSTNEQNQKEFSIHGLSEAQFKFIQFGLLMFQKESKEKETGKLLPFFAKHVFNSEDRKKMEDSTKGFELITEYGIK